MKRETVRRQGIGVIKGLQSYTLSVIPKTRCAKVEQYFTQSLYYLVSENRREIMEFLNWIGIHAIRKFIP